jgi:beta-barrel assembly-enhancing protease
VSLALGVEMSEIVQGFPRENLSIGNRTLLSVVYHIIVKLLAFFLIVALAGAPLRAQQLPDLGDSSASVLSPLQERRFGESIMRQIRSSPEYLDDPEVNDYLERIGFALVANIPDPGGHFEFFAINNMAVNAFALPGGFIGVHTGLILAAQSESELVGVLAHETAHVTQHHIARMMAAQKKSGMASLAAIAVAILAAGVSPELSQAAIIAAQAAPLQSQLNYSRDHEREADRVGLQIVQKSHYDVHAIPMFFERLQRSSRVYEGGAPSYLRTHPMTFERIADIQSRIRDIPFHQIPDSLEFQLVRARLIALRERPADGVAIFAKRIEEKKQANELASRYGLVVAMLRADGLKPSDLATASAHVELLLKDAGNDPMVLALAAGLEIRAGRMQSGLDAYQRALKSFPTRKSLMYGYATALLDNGQDRMAIQFLERAIMRTSEDARLYELEARGHASLGEMLAQHRALAEASLVRGNLAAAIEQLRLAKKSGDGDFYDLSSVDARLRELMILDAEQRRDN